MYIYVINARIETRLIDCCLVLAFYVSGLLVFFMEGARAPHAPREKC